MLICESNLFFSNYNQYVTVELRTVKKHKYQEKLNATEVRISNAATPYRKQSE